MHVVVVVPCGFAGAATRAAALAGEGGLQCIDMLINHRARINDGDIAVPNDIGSSAMEGEAGGIACSDSANKRRQRLNFRVLKLVLIDVRNRDAHQ